MLIITNVSLIMSVRLSTDTKDVHDIEKFNIILLDDSQFLDYI